MTQFSQDFINRLNDIHERLEQIPRGESAFPRVEVLFYDALNLARSTAEEAGFTLFLQDLVKIQQTEYKLTQQRFNKSRQREIVIGKFRNAFRKLLQRWMKDNHQTVLMDFPASKEKVTG